MSNPLPVSVRLTELAAAAQQLLTELRTDTTAAPQVVHDTLAAVDEDLRDAAAYQLLHLEGPSAVQRVRVSNGGLADLVMGRR